jgi:hypothetical protein
MGAFIGYDDIGVWASNRERDAFLDWFAAHCCIAGDAKWEYCKSEAHRWTGCRIELSDLIPRGALFVVSPEEKATAATEFCPEVAELLSVIASITRGEWKHLVDSKEANQWRPIAGAQVAK